MPSTFDPIPLGVRGLRATAAFCAAAGVALLAYAAHAGAANARLQSAGLVLTLHGVAVAAMGSTARGRTEQVALAGLVAGALLFAGALLAAHLLGASTRAAPVGGVLVIASWFALALTALRR